MKGYQNFPVRYYKIYKFTLHFEVCSALFYKTWFIMLLSENMQMDTRLQFYISINQLSR